MLNVKPSNLMFLKTYNTEFNDYITKFVDKNRRLSEIEGKINCLSINRNEEIFCRTNKDKISSSG